MSHQIAIHCLKYIGGTTFLQTKRDLYEDKTYRILKEGSCSAYQLASLLRMEDDGYREYPDF